MVKVKNSDGIYIHLTHVDELALYFTINNSSEKLEDCSCYLYSFDGPISESDFYAEQIGSLIYLTFDDSNRVYLVYDLTIDDGYPSCKNENVMQEYKKADEIFAKIHKIKPNLISDWNSPR